jgi:hypothetical protein
MVVDGERRGAQEPLSLLAEMNERIYEVASVPSCGEGIGGISAASVPIPIAWSLCHSR